MRCPENSGNTQITMLKWRLRIARKTWMDVQYPLGLPGITSWIPRASTGNCGAVSYDQDDQDRLSMFEPLRHQKSNKQSWSWPLWLDQVWIVVFWIPDFGWEKSAIGLERNHPESTWNSITIIKLPASWLWNIPTCHQIRYPYNHTLLHVYIHTNNIEQIILDDCTPTQTHTRIYIYMHDYICIYDYIRKYVCVQHIFVFTKPLQLRRLQPPFETMAFSHKGFSWRERQAVATGICHRHIQIKMFQKTYVQSCAYIHPTPRFF